MSGGSDAVSRSVATWTVRSSRGTRQTPSRTLAHTSGSERMICTSSSTATPTGRRSPGPGRGHRHPARPAPPRRRSGRSGRRGAAARTGRAIAATAAAWRPAGSRSLRQSVRGDGRIARSGEDGQHVFDLAIEAVVGAIATATSAPAGVDPHRVSLGEQALDASKGLETSGCSVHEHHRRTVAGVACRQLGSIRRRDGHFGQCPLLVSGSSRWLRRRSRASSCRRRSATGGFGD